MAYQKLCTEFYNSTKPKAPDAEVDFYKHLCRSVKGKILEAMCGSGRLLIPLLQQGLIVEGVDNSQAMLESCRERCAVENLQPILYKQSLEQLNLEQQYGAIIIAVGSFQLLSDRQQALHSLRLLHDHLMPGGFLLLDFFVPTDFLALQEDCFSTERHAHNSDGSIIHLTTDFTMHAREQYCTMYSRYQKIIRGLIIDCEDEELSLRWYYPEQMMQLLIEAGFNKMIMHESFFQPAELSTIMQAFK